MSSLEFDALSKVWYYVKLMDSASFQSFTKVLNHMHVTKLACLGWMITLWTIVWEVLFKINLAALAKYWVPKYVFKALIRDPGCKESARWNRNEEEGWWRITFIT